jgi:uncharacterized tellurite resistance protein B-like protein
MLRALIDRLFGPYETPLAELDARHALAGMLVRIAKADGTYDAAEIARIDEVLRARYGLGPVEAAKLRAEAEKLEATGPSDSRFAAVIRDRTRAADRRALLEAMWRVMLADGVAGPQERRYLERSAERLGLSEQERAQAETDARSATNGPPAD